MKIKSLVAAALAAAVIPAQAAIVVTEVAPWSSGNSSVAADWFELTNTGTTAVNIGGWAVDDDSNTFANARALTGIASIAPGESVIFIDTTGAAVATFRSVWGVPPGLQIGTYTGAGIGLSTGGDQVNIFDAGGTPQANVSFGASPGASPFATFDNTAGTSGAISALSAVGVNGAFSVLDGGSTLIGSPGLAPIPEPSTVALLALGLLALFGFVARRKQA